MQSNYLGRKTVAYSPLLPAEMNERKLQMHKEGVCGKKTRAEGALREGPIYPIKGGK